MKKLLLILALANFANFANSQIVVKEKCHNTQYGIESDSVYIEIVVTGKIDIRQGNIPKNSVYANSYLNLQAYMTGLNPLPFAELPNLYEYYSDETDYYIKYKTELLRLNPTWSEKNIIILSE